MSLKQFAYTVNEILQHATRSPVVFVAGPDYAEWSSGIRKIYVRQARGVSFLSGCCDAIAITLSPEGASLAAARICRELGVPAS